MANLVIHIKYQYGSVIVRFDPENPPRTGDLIQAEGYWPDQNTSALYNEMITYHVEEDGTHVLRLESSPEIVGNVDPDLDFYWGAAIIRLQKDLKSVTAEWESADQSEDGNGQPIGCIVLEENDERVIEYETSVRIKRAQEKLRKHLIELDKACVISGETTLAALQAAHILDVAEKGADNPSNAVLMRADLHALFDRGVFFIADDGGIQVQQEESLSQTYRNLLCRARVNSAVIDRIRKNLARRQARDADE